MKKVEEATGLPDRDTVEDTNIVLFAALCGTKTKSPSSAKVFTPVREKPAGPCDKCDGPHDETVCPFFKGNRDTHSDAL